MRASAARPNRRARTRLLRVPYTEGALAMYDVSPDRTRFAIVTGGAGAERLVVALDVLGADHRPEGAKR